MMVGVRVVLPLPLKLSVGLAQVSKPPAAAAAAGGVVFSVMFTLFVAAQPLSLFVISRV